MRLRIEKESILLILLVVALSVIGVLAVGSAQPGQETRQAAGTAIGAVLMLALALCDFRKSGAAGWLLYAAGLLLLSLVFLFGDEAGGATRWVSVAGLRFQPSEISKILFLLFFASFFEERQETVKTWKTLVIWGILAAVPLFLILQQPNLSMCIVLAVTLSAMAFLAGIRIRTVLRGLLVLIPSAAGILFLLSRLGYNLFASYQFRRIQAWLHPEIYAQESYQQRNSVMAIGSGLLWGKGLGNEDLFSVKNGGFIPEPQTDFIMAVIGEETGFMGCLLVICLLAALSVVCIRIGIKARTVSGRLYCAGYGVLVGIQAFVNIGVVSGLLPNTGLTLPFVSYGLSSLLSLFAGAGLVLGNAVRLEKSRELSRAWRGGQSWPAAASRWFYGRRKRRRHSRRL